AAARPTASNSCSRPDRLRRRRRCRPHFKRSTNLARRFQRAADEGILGIAIQREQAIAMFAIDLVAIAHLVGLVAKHPGAARALDPHLVIDHYFGPSERPA